MPNSRGKAIASTYTKIPHLEPRLQWTTSRLKKKGLYREGRMQVIVKEVSGKVNGGSHPSPIVWTRFLFGCQRQS
jgi:hypothetical protein